jgi:hypothetical protein
MGDRLKVPFRAYVKGGGVLTFVGTAENQAVYWSLLALDPNTGLYWGPMGELAKVVTLTDKSRCATNAYLAPDHDPAIRYGMGYKFGDGVRYGEGVDLYDQVTAKAVLA